MAVAGGCFAALSVTAECNCRSYPINGDFVPTVKRNWINCR